MRCLFTAQFTKHREEYGETKNRSIHLVKHRLFNLSNAQQRVRDARLIYMHTHYLKCLKQKDSFRVQDATQLEVK